MQKKQAVKARTGRSGPTPVGRRTTGKKYSLEEAFQVELVDFNNGKHKILQIGADTLKVRLRDFRDAVKNKEFLVPAVGVIGMWVPVFTSDFRGIGNFDSSDVRLGYIAMAIVLSTGLLKNGKSSLKAVWHRFSNKNGTKEQRMKYEADPDKLADLLCEQEKGAK